MTNVDDEIIMIEFFEWRSLWWYWSVCMIDLTNIESIYAHLAWDLFKSIYLFKIKSLDGKLSCRARKKGSLMRNYPVE
jgi:hypothetical protein